ncbi:MAG: hypothetical protein V4492_01930 [Chlamydiota bacterium]
MIQPERVSMKIFFILFLYATTCVYSYVDEELLDLWSSVSDIYNPTLDDYKLIESYLKYGKRPYLENLPEVSWKNIPKYEIKLRTQIMRDFKLLGPNDEMPIYEVHHLNVVEETRDRCILIYGSFNDPYPQKAFRILEELRKWGYSGTVMIRIGGFPNMIAEGIKSSPFHGRWKVEFFKEALRMGYRKIVHLDTHATPLNDLSLVFDILEETGCFYVDCGPWLKINENFVQFAEPLGIPPNEVEDVRFIIGCVLGLDFSNTKISRLFQEWDDRMQKIDQFYCIGIDEMSFMSLAWKYRLTGVPTDYVKGGEFLPEFTHPSNTYLFFFDRERDYIRKVLYEDIYNN